MSTKKPLSATPDSIIQPTLALGAAAKTKDIVSKARSLASGMTARPSMIAAPLAPSPGPNAMAMAAEQNRLNSARPVGVAPAPGSNALPNNIPRPVGVAPPLADSRMMKARAFANGGGSTLGKLGARLGAAGAVGSALIDSTEEDSTKRYAERFGVDEPTGDGSFADMAKFAGLRAGGFASDLGSAVSFGLADKLYRDTPNTAQKAFAAPQTALNGPGAAQTAPGAAIAPLAVETSVQPEKLAGEAFGDVPGVRKLMGPGGVPMYSNATTDASDQAVLAGPAGIRGSVNTQDVGTFTGQKSADLQSQISLMRAGLRDRGDINAYVSSATQQAGQQPGGVSSELRAQVQRVLAKNGRLGRNSWNALAQAETNDVTRRGQDMDLAGRQSTERAAGLGARSKQIEDERKAGLDERKFAFEQQKFGIENGTKGANAAADREDKDFAQRDTAARSLDERAKTLFTKDGKVDTERVAEYRQAANYLIKDRAGKLQAEIDKGGENAKQAKDELAMLRSKGVASLKEEQLARMDSQLLLKQRMRESQGLTGGSFVDSQNPEDYQVTEAGDEPMLFGSRMLKTQGGGTVRENDVTYDEAGNPLFTNRFKNKSRLFDGAKGIK